MKLAPLPSLRRFWFCSRCGRSFFLIGRARQRVAAPMCSHAGTGMAGLPRHQMVRIAQRGR